MRASFLRRTALFLFAALCATRVFAAAPPDAMAGVHPDAVEALQKVAAALRARDTFVLWAQISTEDALNSLDTLVDEGTVRISIRGPDRFRITENTRILDREIFADGRTVTVFSPRLNFRTSFPAAPTIAETILAGEKTHGVQLPLAELFVWASDSGFLERLTTGIPAGTENVGGRLCDHFLFRHGQIDWELWVAAEPPSLPCKVTVSQLSGEAQLPSRYTATLAFSFPPFLADDVFIFVPPEEQPTASLESVVISARAERAPSAPRLRPAPPVCRFPYAHAGATCRPRTR
jgi:hypothetical protein